ncbi:MAG: hypothetical protein QM627_12760 [Luteolibacter sp.]
MSVAGGVHRYFSAVPRPTKTNKPTPSSVRIPSELLLEIKKVAEVMSKSDAEVIRLATEIGLEHLRRIDYEIAKAVVDAAEKKVVQSK